MEEDDQLDYVENPRNFTLFRAVMEKKLGIDWEHGPRKSHEISYSSLNTDMVQDGYADAQSRSDFLHSSNSNEITPKA